MTATSENRDVVLVVNSLARGGMEHMVVALARCMRDRGRYRPVVVCLGEAGELAAQLGGVELHAGLLRCKYDIAMIRRLRGLLANAAAATIVNPGGDRMFWTSLARGWRRTGRPALLLWCHSTPSPSRRIIEPLNRLLVSRLDAIAVLGARQLDLYATIERLPRERMRVIPNGLPLDRLERLADRSARHAVRMELGLSAGELLVMCVANPRPVKRVDLFCHLAAALRDRQPRLRFRLIGEGPSDRGIEDTIARLGLVPPLFEWLGRRDDLDRLWPAADIGVCCSDSEGLSIATLEAMAAGVAFVSTDVGEQASAITDGQTGLLVEANRADSLADAVLRVASDDALRARLGAAGAARVREHFSADAMAAAFEAMVDDATR